MAEGKNKEVKKGIIKKAVCCSVLTVLLGYAFRCFIAGCGEQVYDTLKGRYYWQGLILLGISLLLVYKPNYKNVFLYIITGVYGIVSFYLLKRTGFKENSPELWAWYTRLAITAGTVVPVLVDAVFQRRFKGFSANKVIALGLCSSPIVFSLAFWDKMDWKLILLIAIVWIYAGLDYSKESLHALALCSTIGILLATTYTLIKGFMVNPYHMDWHYVGTFSDSPVYAACMACGVVMCMTSFLSLSFRKKTLRIASIIAEAVFSAVFLFAVFIANGRNAFLALAVTLILASYIWSIKKGNTKPFLVILLSVLLLGILMVLLVGVLTVTAENEHFAWVQSVPQLELLRELGLKTLNTQTRHGIIPDGSRLNCIDNFTSGRLSIWLATIRQLKLFQGNDTLIAVTEEYSQATHNAYLGLLNKYGIVMGGSFIAGMVLSFGLFVRKVFKEAKEEKKTEIIHILPVLWMLYFACIFINETFYVMSYPIIVWMLFVALFLPNNSFFKKGKG